VGTRWLISRPISRPQAIGSLTAAVSQHAQELDIVLLAERQHSVIEQIGRRDGRLAVVELGKAYLGVGINEGLLVDTSNTEYVGLVGAALWPR
jgi:hypothetical protein